VQPIEATSTKKKEDDMTTESLQPIPPPEPEHLVGQRTEEASDMAETVRDKAAQVADNVKDKAQQVGGQVAAQADAATTTVGEKMAEVAQMLREKTPVSGPVAGAADTAAYTLDRAGSYLQEQDLAAMRADLENLIRQHPIEAVLVGVGVGYLVGRVVHGGRYDRA
jgi:ElaB/YqjD/DUF883 family membrane-anchored ribosome-binding protein